MKKLQEHLNDIGACPTARDWAGDRTPRQAWDEATRADWLLWWARKLGVEQVTLARAACQIARTVLHLVPSGEERPRLAIEAAERWCENPTEENLQAAAAAEEAAREAARAAEEEEAASSEAAAAEAAARAAWAAAGAEAAEAAVVEAAWAAPDLAPEHCRIVRQLIPFEEIEGRMA